MISITDRRKMGRKAVNDLLLRERKGSLYVITDEIRFNCVNTFCDKIQSQVSRLYLWMASCYHGEVPASCHVEYLTRPLRSPPAVVREMQQDAAITEWRHVRVYSERGVTGHTDGPPVKQIFHQGQDHSAYWPQDCMTCGHAVANFLHTLGVPINFTPSTTVTTNSSTTPPCLQ